VGSATVRSLVILLGEAAARYRVGAVLDDLQKQSEQVRSPAPEALLVVDKRHLITSSGTL
jgi:hypothetical protein